MGQVVRAAKLRITSSIDQQAPDLVWATAARGEDIQVEVSYEILEATTRRERYRLRLESAVGAQRPQPVEVRLGDLPGKWRKRDGTLVQTYRFDDAGHHVGTVNVEIEYRVRGWLGFGSKLGASRRLELPVRFEVN